MDFEEETEGLWTGFVKLTNKQIKIPFYASASVQL